MKVIWQQGLLWPVLRMLVSVGLWMAGTFILTTIPRWILPAAGAAEILVSFGAWAYTTTMDCIAFASSSKGSKEILALEQGRPTLDMELALA